MPTILAAEAKPVIENISNEYDEVFYQSAEFWVGIAFILVVYLLAKPVYKVIKGMIEQRIKRIKDDFHYAENLKLDAQKLYAEYERKYLNTETEVAAIVAKEKAAMDENKEQKMQAMAAWLKQKNKEADARIEISFEQANAEINHLISQRTTDILKNIFRTKMSKAEHEKLINHSIKRLETINIKK